MNQTKQHRICLYMMLLQFVFAGLLYFFYMNSGDLKTGIFLLQISQVLFCGGLLSLLAWRHAVLAYNAFLEKRSSETKVVDNIFTNEDDLLGRQERAFLQFNKIYLPIVLVTISLIEVFLSGRFFFIMPEGSEGKINLLIPSAVLTALSIVLFLAGKFVSGMAYSEKLSFLRPICGYLLLNSFLTFLGLIVALCYHFGISNGLPIFLWFSVCLCLLLAVERLLLWIIDLYRPKSRDEDYIPIYESRILALFSQPRGVLGNLASMLEYQFGIKISEASFAVFFKKVLLPYLCIQVLSLFILSTITYIKANEKGLKFSYGQSEFKVLEPGVHLTAPWPFCQVDRYDVERVQEVSLIDNGELNAAMKDVSVDLWTNTSYLNLMSMTAVKSNEANDHNLAVINVKLKYKISDVLQYRNAFVNSEQGLKMFGQQTLSRLLVENDFNAILYGRLGEFTQLFLNELSKNTKTMGIDLVGVEFINFQPPPEVAESYQDKLDAQQESVKLEIEAQRYSTVLLSKADIRSDKEVKTARSETVLKSKLLDARLASFESQLQAYKALPMVYEMQAKMIAFESWIKHVRKVVNLTGIEKEIITLELKKNDFNLFETEEKNEK